MIPRRNVPGIMISTILQAACTAHYTDTDNPFVLPLLLLLHEAILSISIHYRISKNLSRTQNLVMGCYQSTLPVSSSSFTTASCPFAAATESGIWLTSTLPVSNSSFTTDSCPFFAAQKSGVRLSSSFESISTLSVSSSSFTTASCPFSAAHERVWPSEAGGEGCEEVFSS